MTELTPDQRNYYYLLEAERTGIHKPILAALYEAHDEPLLSDGEMGLGIVPINQVSLEQIDTFSEQVQYAANTIRTLTDNLIQQGWEGSDLFHTTEDCYTEPFLEIVAQGYLPSQEEVSAARLQPCSYEQLRAAYLKEVEQEYENEEKPKNLANLDTILVSLIERIPAYYLGLSHQREALLEAARIWRKLDARDAVIGSFAKSVGKTPSSLTEPELDTLLKQFMQRISPYYGGYPHQREALLRLTQLWRELPTREMAIASLEKDSSPNPGLGTIDPALIAFVQRIPKYYESKGNQRNAITEAVRIWKQLGSRSVALASLGIEPTQLASTSTQEKLNLLATQIDRELMNFVKRIPKDYQEESQQREALIRMVQLWRGITTRQQTISALTEDLKSLERQRQAEQSPIIVIPPPPRPDRWTTSNIQLSMSIIPDGNFTWAEATHGGTRMPTNQATVEAMIRIAKLAQRARDRIGRPFIITSWYRPPHINRAVGGATYSRHIVGDAIDFVVENMSGNQLYWELHPWWPGGLGRYIPFPNLCHIDARSHRARWQN